MKHTKRITFSSIMLSIILLVSSAAGCNPSPGTKASVNIVMAPYFGTWLCTYAITSGLITSDLVDITVDQSAKFDDQMLAGNYPIGVSEYKRLLPLRYRKKQALNLKKKLKHC